MATKLIRWTLTALLTTASVSFAATSSAQPGHTSATSHKVHHSKKKSRSHKVRGQKAIDGDRVREIQQALIHEHYLKGSATGKWDDATQAAMRRYQSDQGWQSKTVPDSRALIRLGLGPDQEHLLNPESAMTSQPARRASARSETTASSSNSSQGTSIPASAASGSVSPAAAMPGDPSR